jgi:hypothetical protein
MEYKDKDIMSSSIIVLSISIAIFINYVLYIEYADWNNNSKPGKWFDLSQNARSKISGIFLVYQSMIEQNVINKV